MSENTAISWCDHTFNPWHGCRPVSAACSNCYARMLTKRFGPSLPWDGTKYRIFDEKHWNEPHRWNAKAAKTGKRERVFCGSMCDVFDGNILLQEERDKLWPLIESTPALDWLLLTKRPENIRMPFSLPLENVWLGTTVEDRSVLGRIAELKRHPAAVHFLSCEPLLGDLGRINLTGIDWVICGCESGPGARAMNWLWSDKLLGQCLQQNTPFFFKQAKTAQGKLDHEPLLHGRTWRQFPEPRR